METLQKFISGLGLFLLMLLFSAKSQAQIQASFAPSATTVNCPPAVISFTDSSKGAITSWSWNFGDNSTSTLQNPSHSFAKTGRYNVKLVVRNAVDSATMTSTIVVLGPTVQFSKIIDTVCSSIRIKFNSKATGGDPMQYIWDFGDGTGSKSITSTITHNFAIPSTNFVSLTVRDTNGCSVKVGDTLKYTSLNPVAATTPKSLVANRECDDVFGWTNYYYDNGTVSTKDDILMLSLKKNGNTIGTLTDGTFKVELVATANAGSSQGITINSPLIANPSGYYAMNRFWRVTPTKQPTSAVGVRFYFNTADLTDINGTFPTHDAILEQLIFYKTKGGNPDPTTNFAGATDITSIVNGSDADETHWVYSSIASGCHSAEFLVSSFSGGGAGVTGNGATLPVKLVAFNGKTEGSAVKLNWTVTSELNVERFEIEASVDGRTFTTIGKVAAQGNNSGNSDYTFNDFKVSSDKARFYKLITVDKDGKKSYSEVIRITFGTTLHPISLYPVPATNHLTVTTKAVINKASTVEVYNSLGLRVMQVVKTAPGNSFELSTTTLPNGTYRLIIFNNDSKIGDASFIVNR